MSSMDRALPRPLVIPWRPVLLALYVGINFGLVLYWRPFEPVGDWALYNQLVPAFLDGTLYEITDPIAYVWSPLLVPVQATVGWMGVWPSAILTLAIPLLLRNPVQIVVLYSSFMFWPTVFSGSVVFILTLVAGALAFRGNARWGVVFVALVLLAPRPLFIPLVAWVLWRLPETRWPVAWTAAIIGVLTLASGYAFEWIAAGLRYGAVPGFDMGLTAIFGKAWLLVGVPLGVWLTYRNHPGWAGLMVSPYTLHGYFLWPIVEIRSPLVPRGVHVTDQQEQERRR